MVPQAALLSGFVLEGLAHNRLGTDSSVCISSTAYAKRAERPDVSTAAESSTTASTATLSLPIRARKSQVVNSKNFKLIIEYGSNAATLWILQITRGKQRVCGSRRRRWSEAVLV